MWKFLLMLWGFFWECMVPFLVQMFLSLVVIALLKIDERVYLPYAGYALIGFGMVSVAITTWRAWYYIRP
jgi:hypothetical protein